MTNTISIKQLVNAQVLSVGDKVYYAPNSSLDESKMAIVTENKKLEWRGKNDQDMTADTLTDFVKHYRKSGGIPFNDCLNSEGIPVSILYASKKESIAPASPKRKATSDRDSPPKRRKESGAEYQKKIKLLFRKNQGLSKINLRDVLSWDVFSQLTDEEKRELSKDLPAIDLDRNGMATRFMFDNQFFKSSRRQLHDLLEEGYLHPSRNFKEEIEENQQINEKNGMKKEGVNEFWLKNVEAYDMSWLNKL